MSKNKTHIKSLPRKALVTAITASLALTAGSASGLEVTGSFSGLWDQPEQRNHGLVLTISTLPSGEKTAVGFWAHFNDEGQPSWLYAQGPIAGNTIQADLYSFEGISFMEAKSVQKNQGVAIGTMDITFSDCNGGNVAFSTTDTEVGSGYFEINRLTSQPGVRCTGGISDDRSPDARPEVFEIELAPTEPYEGKAEGKARFKDTPDESEFEVEIEVSEAGEYLLFVQDHESGMPASDSNGNPIMVERGSMPVTRNGHFPEQACGSCHSVAKVDSEIKFSSPNFGDEKPLDFDPRGSLIEVRLEQDVVLVGLVDEEGTVIGMDTDDVPEFGDQKIKIRFSNEFGDAEAELDPHDDEVEFEIEIEDVQPGPYSVTIEGVTWELTVPDGQDEGELEFRFPPEVGTLPLNFDPRGKEIEISGETATFTFDFPLEAIENDDDSDDDDDEDDSSDDDDDEDGSSDDDDNEDGGSDDDDNEDGGSDDDDDEDGSSDDDDNEDGGSDDDDNEDGGSDDDDNEDGGSDDDEDEDDEDDDEDDEDEEDDE